MIVSAACSSGHKHSVMDAALEKSSGRSVAHARCGLPPGDTAPSNQPLAFAQYWLLADGATVRHRHSKCGGYPVVQSTAWRSAAVCTVQAATHTP